jgi:hypothetical protein
MSKNWLVKYDDTLRCIIECNVSKLPKKIMPRRTKSDQSFPRVSMSALSE